MLFHVNSGPAGQPAGLFLCPGSGQNHRMPDLIPNFTTPEGRELGRHMARLCDVELLGKPDRRCATCAFRAGDHLANGSPITLMCALKCSLEGTPFYCHEADRPCAGWSAMHARPGKAIRTLWEHCCGFD